MKIFLIILLCILILLSLVFFVPVTLKIYLSEKGKIVIKYLVFKKNFDIYGKDKKALKDKKYNSNKNNGKSSSSKTRKSDKKNTDYIKSIIKDKGVLDGTIFILNIIKALFQRLIFFIKKGRFKELNLKIDISSELAGDTAIAYGGICAVAYPIVGFVNSNFSIDKENVDIKCSYLDKNNLNISFYAVYRVRIIHLIRAIILFTLDYMKINPQNKNLKGSYKNGRT